jgi:hypothetical protein
MMVLVWVLVHPRLNSTLHYIDFTCRDRWFFTMVYISVGLLLEKKPIINLNSRIGYS